MTRTPDFRVFFLGDMALQVVGIDTLPSPHLSQTLRALAHYMRDFPFVSAAICAFDNVTLLLKPDTDAKFALQAVQRALGQEFSSRAENKGHTHLICFSRAALDVEFRSDLAALATHARQSEHEWLTQFCATVFTVAMIGFKPGFPYLLGLPEALAMPRLAKPRISVVKGSVAVGGAFAGIYPARSAGGWHVIGVTDAILFDVARAEPCLFAAGDSVRFELQEKLIPLLDQRDQRRRTKCAVPLRTTLCELS